MSDSWIRNEYAGDMWHRGLRGSHKALCVRTREASSDTRSTGINREILRAFFENFLELLLTHNNTANKICKQIDTGNSTAQYSPQIVCPKGIKQVGILTLVERGINSTLIVDVNAIGNQVRPVLIFPRAHFKNYMLTGAYTVSIGDANPTGWSI